MVTAPERDPNQRPWLLVEAMTREVDVEHGWVLRHSIVEAVEKGFTDILLDLTDVDLIDATGLGILVGALKRVSDLGGSLALVCDKPQVLGQMRRTGVIGLFAVYPSVEGVPAPVSSVR